MQDDVFLDMMPFDVIWYVSNDIGIAGIFGPGDCSWDGGYEGQACDRGDDNGGGGVDCSSSSGVADDDRGGVGGGHVVMMVMLVLVVLVVVVEVV